MDDVNYKTINICILGSKRNDNETDIIYLFIYLFSSSTSNGIEVQAMT